MRRTLDRYYSPDIYTCLLRKRNCQRPMQEGCCRTRRTRYTIELEVVHTEAPVVDLAHGPRVGLVGPALLAVAGHVEAALRQTVSIREGSGPGLRPGHVGAVSR